MVKALVAAVVLKGAYPLLVTPYTEKAELDHEILVREAEYVDAQGVGGVIWPTANEINILDELGEYESGLTALADRWAKGGMKSRLTAVCCGTNSATALKRVELWDAIVSKRGISAAILARPPDDAKTDAAMEAHYRLLATKTSLPVIIQTFCKGSNPQPSVDLLVRLSRDFPNTYGYFKEESNRSDVNDRIAAMMAAKPVVKGVFSGWGATQFLYQGPRLGTTGIITQRPMYAGLLHKMLDLTAAGKTAADPELADTFGRYLVMVNLGEVFKSPGTDGGSMRGPHLVVFKRLGVLRNTLTRTVDKNGRKSVTSFDLPPKAIEEIDARIKSAGLQVW